MDRVQNEGRSVSVPRLGLKYLVQVLQSLVIPSLLTKLGQTPHELWQLLLSSRFAKRLNKVIKSDLVRREKAQGFSGVVNRQLNLINGS